jgi:glyoxylase I family protein
MIQLKGIHHIALLTSNELYELSKQFYTEILGFTVLSEHFREERQSHKLDLALNGMYLIELFSFPDFKERNSFPESKGLRHLAFAVENVEEGYRWLKEKGIETAPVRIDNTTGKSFLFFYDPNGQPLELYQL